MANDQLPRPPFGLQFINISSLEDASTGVAISQIRSHVARHGHTRRRERNRVARSHTRISQGADRGALAKSLTGLPSNQYIQKTGPEQHAADICNPTPQSIASAGHDGALAWHLERNEIVVNSWENTRESRPSHYIDGTIAIKSRGPAATSTDKLPLYLRSQLARLGINGWEPRSSIPANLSPYPAGDAFSIADSNRYFQFYIEEVIPQFLPLWNNEDNPFLTIAIPASFHSPMVRHAIHAIAASQAALTSSCKKQDAFKALWHQHHVMESTRLALSSGRGATVTGLIACLLMQSSQSLTLGLKDWHQWLKGCVIIIQERNRVEKDIIEDTEWHVFTKCVVAMLALTAATGGIEIDSSLASQYWKLYLASHPSVADERGHRQNTFTYPTFDDGFFSKMFGCPAIVILILSEVAEFIAAWKHNKLYQLDTLAYRRFDGWENALICGSPPNTDTQSKHIMEMFRHATLVHFQRRIRRLPYSHTNVQRHVHLTLEQMSSVASSRYSIASTWPIVVAASELDEEEYPDIAVTLLQRMQRIVLDGCCDPVFQKLGLFFKGIWEQRRACKTAEEKNTVYLPNSVEGRESIWCF